MILGILGGSGLYDLDGLVDARSVEVLTPYGPPSGPLRSGRIGEAQLLFLPRHGAGHRFSPSEINYRANVFALKAAGATRVLSVSAVGSLREGMPPGDLVLADQFIDKTFRRASTFFGDGAVGHVSFAEPTCAAFSAAVAAAAAETGVREAPAAARLTSRAVADGKRLHRGGTYVCMEGPQFSTRAESLLHRSWGADLIGMTAATEAKLCREAELCFASLALVTDYDCWHTEEEAVTAAGVVAVLAANVAGAKEIVRRLPTHASFAADCGCARAAAHAILTAPEAITPEARQRLRALHGRELNMSSSASPLLVVGSVGLDTVETRAGKKTDVLGGAASYFSVAASFLAPVRLTGVVGTDFPDAHTKLFESHAVDLAGLERVPGKTFRWSGVYAPDFSTRTTLDTQLNVFSDFRPKLPAAWADSPYVFLANIDPVLQLSVLEQTEKAGKKPKFVACDTMNFWIEGKRPDLLNLLKRVDMLLLNDEEARQLSGQANLPAAARAIRALGPRAVVIKRGDAGALLFHEGGVFAAPAFPIENVVDPTGAGDSFGGGFMGWIAREGDTSPATIRTAMILGSVLASFSVEDFSLDRFKRLDLAQIRERFAAFADLVHFEKIKI